jgi:hypothetical protein
MLLEMMMKLRMMMRYKRKINPVWTPSPFVVVLRHRWIG